MSYLKWNTKSGYAQLNIIHSKETGEDKLSQESKDKP